MFDKLLLSTKDRRKGRTGKFLFVTSLFYSLVLASALVVSVIAANPMLYEEMEFIKLASIPPAPPPLKGDNRVVDKGGPKNPASPSIYNPVTPLDQLNAAATTKPLPNVSSSLPTISDVGSGPVGDPNGVEGGSGPIGSKSLIPGALSEGIELPPPPVTKTVEKTQPPVEKQLVRLSSHVLTGKALERRTPTYPILAKQARIEGSIVVEVIISLDGRVESARPLGGHPLLIQAAVEAARGWRFQPTLLNGVAVRVTGVITFNFKLN